MLIHIVFTSLSALAFALALSAAADPIPDLWWQDGKVFSKSTTDGVWREIPSGERTYANPFPGKTVLFEGGRVRVRAEGATYEYRDGINKLAFTDRAAPVKSAYPGGYTRPTFLAANGEAWPTQEFFSSTHGHVRFAVPPRSEPEVWFRTGEIRESDRVHVVESGGELALSVTLPTGETHLYPAVSLENKVYFRGDRALEPFPGLVERAPPDRVDHRFGLMDQAEADFLLEPQRRRARETVSFPPRANVLVLEKRDPVTVAWKEKLRNSCLSPIAGALAEKLRKGSPITQDELNLALLEHWGSERGHWGRLGAEALRDRLEALVPMETPDPDPHAFKKRIEGALQKIAGPPLTYNRAYSTLGDVVESNRLQCRSGTLFFEMMSRLSFPQRTLDAQNRVMIYSNGHLRPGYLKQEKGSWVLYAIEMTAAGGGKVRLGPASAQRGLRLIDANDWALSEIFGRCVSDRAAMASGLVARAHEKYGIPLPEPVAGGGGGGPAVAEDPFAFGRPETPDGDLRRAPLPDEPADPDDPKRPRSLSHPFVVPPTVPPTHR